MIFTRRSEVHRDYTGRKRTRDCIGTLRGKPIAFYTAALTLGAGIASLVAAGVLTWAKTVPQIELPIIGVLAPWQFIFIIVELPGLILALIFTLLREPIRIKETDEDVVPALGLRDMLRYVFQRFGAYFGIIPMVGSMLAVGPAVSKRTP